MQLHSSTIESTQVPNSAPPLAEALPKVSFKDYIALTKPMIISLLLAVTLVPMFLASTTPPSLLLILWVMVGGFLAAGGANTINQYMDRDIDHVMARTRKRPLPGGRMTPFQVLAFGIGLCLASFLLLWGTVNLLTATLALAGILYYVFIYTYYLKRSSPQNIVVGGAAGAVPPLVGWAAVAGELSLLSIFMFLIIFYWTPPHFWAIAIVRKKEYAEAGVPMLSVVAGAEETRQQMLLYTVILTLVCTIPVFLGLLGPVYLVLSLILNGIFLKQAIDIWRGPTEANTRKLYLYSLLYLALIFLAMGLDGLFYRSM